MNIVKEDRRIRRTKKMLQKSLAELITEKDFKDITVKDITERADLNRGTFYLHYCDTYDLLEKIENGLVDDFISMIENYQPTEDNITIFPIVNQILDYITENEEICRTLFLQNNSSHLVEKIIKIIQSQGMEIQKRFHSHLENKILEYRATFIAHGMIGIIINWFEDDMSTSKKTMAQLIDSLIHTIL